MLVGLLEPREGFIFGEHDNVTGIQQSYPYLYNTTGTYPCNMTLNMVAAFEVEVTMKCRTTVGSWSRLSSTNGVRCANLYPYHWSYTFYTAFFDNRMRNCRTGKNCDAKSFLASY